MAAPYPWSSLPPLRRADTNLVARLARALDPGLVAELGALEPLLGAMTAQPAPIERWREGAMAARADVPLVALVIGDALAGPGVRLALELDLELAGRLVDRALGALDHEPRIAVGPATDAERGVLAYLGARALAATAGRLRVVAVVGSVAGLRAAVGEGGLSAWPALVRTAGAEGWARLWVPDAWTPPDRAPAPAAWARELEIVLDVVAGLARLSTGDLRALEPGDVVIPDELSVHGSPLTGPVTVVSPFGGPRLSAELRGDGALVLGRLARGPLSIPGRARVASDMSTHEPFGNEIGEVPVELRVELGRVIVRVAELAALRPGEILTTGTPLGARVALRAGDEIVATGELCDVEGEIGVRVLELSRRG